MKIGRIVRKACPTHITRSVLLSRLATTRRQIRYGKESILTIGMCRSRPLFDSDTMDRPKPGPTQGRYWLRQCKAARFPLSSRRAHAAAAVSAVVCETSGGELNILDFGGGMGITYVHLQSSLVNCRSLNYHVIERAGICKEGAALFGNGRPDHFWTEVPEI